MHKEEATREVGSSPITRSCRQRTVEAARAVRDVAPSARIIAVGRSCVVGCCEVHVVRRAGYSLRSVRNVSPAGPRRLPPAWARAHGTRHCTLPARRRPEMYM
eukprot:6176109-Pleurochrysis_carterae.AAC.1